MKIRVLALLLCVAMAFGLCACTGNGDGEEGGNNGGFLGNLIGGDKENTDGSGNSKKDPKMTKDYTDPSIYTMDTLVSMGIEEARPTDKNIDKAADKMLKKILNNADTLKPAAGGQYIYVANDGADEKGYGYDESKPFKTIGYANLVAKKGDVVLLKRGNFWRETVVCVEGVSYGAYGKGNKPTIYGALRNAATQRWSKESENVYKTPSGTATDIGLIVFDHGKACGSKVWEKESLKKDYDFVSVGGYVYVYLSKGNPADLYSDIEICPTQHIVKMRSNSTIQNWRIMYGGAHGISLTGNPTNVTVDGCVVGYIGGGHQGGAGQYTRYGNGIEVWGTCNGYTIKNCHVYQCYDAGVTMQYSSNTTSPIYEENILFEDNLFEYSVYNIEYFYHVQNSKESSIRNVLIQDNIIRHGGYGWGYYSRSDKNKGTNVQGRGTDRVENFVFKNNIFDHSKSYLIESSLGEGTIVFTGNTYAQLEKSRICQINDKNYGVKRYGKTAITDILGDKTGKLIIIK